ncbi:methyltransferase domain-containing protein [Phycisphaeraceae bacterium D3-23]
MPTPTLSILIPNYNNGVASSKDAATDLLTDLLVSLEQTLADDPTPLEILAFDDGSTDDSLDTLRAWSKKTWRNGQPFLTLLEDEHCGVLSVTANKLVQATTSGPGGILARLDGDIVIHTPNWAQKLCAVFDTGPSDLGVIGPKQLAPAGHIHAMGDMLLHPRGYHHVAEGLPPEQVTKPIEVDHVMGCFYVCKRSVYDALGGYDEDYLRGQTVDFGMRARLAGVRCWAVPSVEFTHRHTLRQDRATTADTDTGVDRSRQTFRDKWGFDRIAPDLDAVRERYAGTPLLWNANVFGSAPGETEVPQSAPPAGFDQSEWMRFNQDPGFQGWTQFKVGAVVQLIQRQIGPIDRPVAVLGCGSGLVVHLLALQGIEAVGVEREPRHVALAMQFAQQHQQRAGYPGTPPRYEVQTALRRMPLDDGSASLACVFDRVEAHDNPVSLLHEAQRIAGPAGSVLAISKCPPLTHDRPMSPYHPLLPKQLAGLVKAATDWPTSIEVVAEHPDRPMVVYATGQGRPSARVAAAGAAPVT